MQTIPVSHWQRNKVQLSLSPQEMVTPLQDQRGCSGVQGGSAKGVFLRRLGLNLTNIPNMKILGYRCFSTL